MGTNPNEPKKRTHCESIKPFNIKQLQRFLERSHASDSMKRSYRTKWVRFRQFSSFPQGGVGMVADEPSFPHSLSPPRRGAGIHPSKARIQDGWRDWHRDCRPRRNDRRLWVAATS